MKQHKTEFRYLLILNLLALLIVSSCVPTSPNSTRSSTDSTTQSEDTDDSNDPSFDSTANYFEYSGNKIASIFQATAEFNDQIFLKGKGVHSFIEENPNKVFCAIAHYGTLGTNKNLVVSAFPRNTIDFTTNTKESYIALNYQSNFKAQNSSFCNNTAVNNVIATLGGGTVYGIDELCPTCNNVSHQSTKYIIVDTDGNQEIPLSTSNLNLKITFTYNGDTTGLCSSDSQCSVQGLDCCLQGQCVKDGELKRAYSNTEPEYNQYLLALLDVNSTPSNFSKYPNFFYVCGQNIPGDGDDDEEDEFTSEELAQLQVNKLKYLYECTTPQDGEVSICTTTYENALSTDGNFYAGVDDRDFSDTYTGTNTPTDTISEIIYQQISLYKDGVYSGTTPGVTITGTNDNLNDKMTVQLLRDKDQNNKYDDLIIRYRIDGSCREVIAGLAICDKYYNQGQNEGRATDHFPASNRFNLPTYANTNREIIVEVDNIVRTKGTKDGSGVIQNGSWDLTLSSPNYIDFGSDSLKVQDSQVVKITFYVDTNVYPVLNSKKTAMEEIGTICKCPNNDCTLKEVLDDNNNVINYQCVPPTTATVDPPLQQKILLSSKNTPHRHFDTNGVGRSDLTLGQINDEPNLKQEGLEFKYTDNDLFKPNNESSYIGFNEIYGSYNYGIGSALPAKEVVVKSGTTYDITVSEGNFSSCFFCGVDYNSNLAKIFPDNLRYSGGGYKPDFSVSSKSETTTYRADDLAFGRACHVPASMIPWSHTANFDSKTQRQNRLAAQHFLFSNGYSRDWYGYDYGSVIGSFDGVRWFAIGTKRRIKAKSNRLYLAVNSYFADLTLENTYNVLIQDFIINGSNDYPTTDYLTDAADCQRAHSCNTDSDCAATLGWEYACEEVRSIKSGYPRFDSNGLEIPNETSIERLLSINGLYSGATKRCVYRGRGAACTPSYDSVSETTSYNGTTSTRTHGCSANNYCQPLIDTITPQTFNNSINRSGKSITLRNNDEDTVTPLPSYGHQAPIIGRPKNYKGTESVNSQARSNLTQNFVNAICVPGTKRPETGDTFITLNSTAPTDGNTGDMINLQGITYNEDTLFAGALSACPILDEDGNYLNFEDPDATVNSATVVGYASSQALSTRFLNIFIENNLNTKDITKDLDNNTADKAYLNTNSCLRAPGATCFTNLDCSPSGHIRNALKSLTFSDVMPNGSSTIMNPYELLFWQEEMVCSQPAKPTDEDFDIRNNRCCREIGNTITIPTVNQSNTPETDITVNGSVLTETLDVENAVGTEKAITSTDRYSRNATSHYQRNLASTTTPELKVATNNSAITVDSILAQYETLTSIASRTCCSENWVRQFADGTNEWRPIKMQKVNVNNFSCLNYTDSTKTNCADPADFSQCTARSIPQIEANTFMKWVGTFDLLGIPNVAIQEPADLGITCSDGTGNVPGFIDGTPSGYEYTEQYYKATDMTNFDENSVSPVFSKDSFNCCMPAGTQMEASDDPNLCCTGYINPTNNRCALRNYTDVSVYLNRYVSSEAKDVSSAFFDQKTGFLKDSSYAIALACEKRLCASGVMANGIAYGKYRFKDVQDNVQNQEVLRFIEDITFDNDTGKVDLYDEGLRWNSHLYCIPPEISQTLNQAGIQVYPCN